MSAPLPQLELDHIVVAAATLAEGVAWCDKTLGIAPSAGGDHPLMGTHNLIFSIASPRFTQAYFEIIAIDPTAAAPSRPRWLGLDEPALQQAIAKAPRLIHWVARCIDIDSAAEALRAIGHDPGIATAAERKTPHGLLCWQLTIRSDGRRLGDGALPSLIEWGDVHPSASLPDCGVALAGVTIGALPEPLRLALGAALSGQVAFDRALASAWRVTLETPLGPVTLDSIHLQN